MDSIIEKPTVENLVKILNSAIGLDISKNHTGIVIYDGETIKDYGFELTDQDKADVHAEYKMRQEFKTKLKEIIKDKHFEYTVVEDVYGGENFDTVRKLLALQTVIDELLFEGIFTTDNFKRWLQPQWAAKARQIYKQTGKLKSKFETQGLLEYLEWDFYIKNKDLSNADKRKIFFEDKCDAMGMIIAAVSDKSFTSDTTQTTSIKMSDIKMVYLEDKNDLSSVRDKRIKEEEFTEVELNYRLLEKSILASVTSNPNDVLVAELPVNKLGHFGLKKKFKFYESGQGYLIFYNRKKE
jgi:hypothetical protein